MNRSADFIAWKMNRLRLWKMNRPTVADILKEHRISLDTSTYQVFVGEKEIYLTITEFNLLDSLLGNKTTLSRDALLSAVWDESYQGTVRTVDTHIQRLRGKLGKAGYLIRTVRGKGYRLENGQEGGTE